MKKTFLELSWEFTFKQYEFEYVLCQELGSWVRDNKIEDPYGILLWHGLIDEEGNFEPHLIDYGFVIKATYFDNNAVTGLTYKINQVLLTERGRDFLTAFVKQVQDEQSIS